MMHLQNAIIESSLNILLSRMDVQLFISLSG